MLFVRKIYSKGINLLNEDDHQIKNRSGFVCEELSSFTSIFVVILKLTLQSARGDIGAVIFCFLFFPLYLK